MAYTFSQMALDHQIRFMKRQGITPENLEKGLLSERDARKYSNFCTAWPDLQKALDLEFPYEKDKLLYRHLTHRRMVAANLFMPIKLLCNSLVVVNWLNGIMMQNIKHIRSLQFDAPCCESQPYLDGQTRFDVFIKAETEGGQELGIGICLRYAEEEDRCLPSQQRLMHNEYDTSCYKQLSEVVGYDDGKLHTLKGEGVNLLWRQHQLGFELLERRELDRFVLLYIFPHDNLFWRRSEALFISCVPYLQHHTFRSMPLELFIGSARRDLNKYDHQVNDWLKYVEARILPRFD